MTRRFRRALILLFVLGAGALARPSLATAGFTEEFPETKKYLFSEPHSNIYLGFGVSPIAILASKVFISADMFEANYISTHWDINLITASIGTAFAKDDFAATRNFTFRMSPKFRIAEYLSIGPMVGLEFVSFPNLQSRINKGGYFSPFEPFSASGVIFGAEASELFHLGGTYLFKVSEVLYKETYSTTTTSSGWNVNYQLDQVNIDHSEIDPSMCFLIQFALLY